MLAILAIHCDKVMKDKDTSQIKILPSDYSMILDG
jgi:hypothetical protein